ncbi:MAG: MCE family protein [Deltaproteobacteria bacterium]|nr:MAG: MCE family protein [Deltaproteobacteria bacterium]TMQ19175.1 MAG: MCE family protein [Deltaproteobacteria bacterium]
MASRAQHIRVGLFATATLILLGVVLAVFGGLRLWDDVDRYRIVFDTSVIGLEPGAQVYLNGIKVGTVDDVDVAASDIAKVAVVIKVKHDAPIHTDTRAILQHAGITGLKTIDLRGGTSATPRLAAGAEIATGTGSVDKLEAQAQAIVDDAAALVRRAHQLTDHLVAVTDSVSAIAEPATRAANELAATSAALRATVDENRAGLRQSIAAIRGAATGASELFDGQAAQLFTSAGDVVAELRKLLVANEGPLRAAVFDLRQASRSFKELARDVRQKPSRLLFSSTPAERQLP